MTLVASVLALACGCSGPEDVPAPIPIGQPVAADYVGTAECARCHGDEPVPAFHATYHDDWLASAHGRTADNAPSETTIVGDRDDNKVSDFRDGLDLSAFEQWKAFTVAGGATADVAPVLGYEAASGHYQVRVGTRVYVVDKVLGIGRHKQTYLTRIGNSLYVLPVLYEVEAKLWRPVMPEDWYTWTDSDSDGVIDGDEQVTGAVYAAADTPVSKGRTEASWERRCAGCHVTGLTSVTRNLDGEFLASYREEGVGCEACHGPGRYHRDNPVQNTIIDPPELTRDRETDVCMSCHTTGSSLGKVGGVSLEYPWHPDGSPVTPGEVLSTGFEQTAIERAPVHKLQGTNKHKGEAGSRFGSWTHECQDCHSAHNTINLALVRMAVRAGTDDYKHVLFQARSGTPGSGGLMGDASDDNYRDVCEVCHTRTRYARNDTSTPIRDHNNGEACTNCHEHGDGFVGANTSTGGMDCKRCHTVIEPAMFQPIASYRHPITDSLPTYPTDESVTRCLTCHVDHDLFNLAAGGRGTNLRTELATAPTPTSGFVNTDFSKADGGGICLTCHLSQRTKSYMRPDGSLEMPAIPFAGSAPEQVDAYAAGAHGGSYKVASKFRDTDEFLADCSKCHNDDLDPKSFTPSQTPVAFGLHKSTQSRMLSPLGFDGANNPLEEQFCYRCHSTAGDPIGGTRKPRSGVDWYGGKTMTARSEGLWFAQQKTYRHKSEAASGRHMTVEGSTWNWNPASNRHVECDDCHNSHATGPARAFNTSGVFAQPATPTNLVANTPLQNVWGADVPSWPAAWTAPDPATEFARVEKSTYEWQVCLKCHSGYGYGTTLPAGETDQALEFNPNNRSYHAVIGASKTTTAPNSSYVSPWTGSSQMACSDCHTSDTKTGAQGPHGSNHKGVLAGAFGSNTGQSGTESHLCFKCHSFNVYGRGGRETGGTGFSNSEGKNYHVLHMKEGHFQQSRNSTCFDCHAAVPHGWHRRAMLIAIGDPAPYNNGSAAMSLTDIQNAPAPGNWRENSCSASPCHRN